MLLLFSSPRDPTQSALERDRKLFSLSLRSRNHGNKASKPVRGRRQTRLYKSWREMKLPPSVGLCFFLSPLFFATCRLHRFFISAPLSPWTRLWHQPLSSLPSKSKSPVPPLPPIPKGNKKRFPQFPLGCSLIRENVGQNFFFHAPSAPKEGEKTLAHFPPLTPCIFLILGPQNEGKRGAQT